MVIISKGILHEFSGKHPQSIASLNEWYRKVKKEDWKSYSEVNQVFNSVDAIGNYRYVFNISGNNYRLVALIHFGIRTLYIRGIFTHAEYDQLNKSGKLMNL